MKISFQAVKFSMYLSWGQRILNNLWIILLLSCKVRLLQLHLAAYGVFQSCYWQVVKSLSSFSLRITFLLILRWLRWLTSLNNDIAKSLYLRSLESHWRNFRKCCRGISFVINTFVLTMTPKWSNIDQCGPMYLNRLQGGCSLLRSKRTRKSSSSIGLMLHVQDAVSVIAICIFVLYEASRSVDLMVFFHAQFRKVKRKTSPVLSLIFYFF